MPDRDPGELAAELREPQLLDVLASAGNFLYEHGVSEGAVACDAAADLLPRAADALDSLARSTERADETRQGIGRMREVTAEVGELNDRIHSRGSEDRR